MVIFFLFFCFLKSAEIPIFIVFFWTSTKICPKNGPQKNDNFSHSAKHRVIKKPVLLQPPFWLKIGVFSTWFFFETKNNDVEQKHNFKSAKKQDKKKGLERKTKTGNQKKENIDEKNLQLNILMLFLWWKKSKEERKRKKETKTRNQKKAKKKDKKEERQKRRKERDREREIEKGGAPKKLRRNKGRH